MANPREPYTRCGNKITANDNNWEFIYASNNAAKKASRELQTKGLGRGQVIVKQPRKKQAKKRTHNKYRNNRRRR